MISKLKAAPRALAVLMFAPTFAQSSSAGRGAGNLVGEWRMTSLEVGPEGGLQPVPYSGHVIFTTTGTMSVQATNPDSEAPDTRYTVNGYEAFYGIVEVERSAGRFAVTVESSVARDLIGQTLTRAYDVSGDTLVLTPIDASEGWRVTYQRVRSQTHPRPGPAPSPRR